MKRVLVAGLIGAIAGVLSVASANSQSAPHWSLVEADNGEIMGINWGQALRHGDAGVEAQICIHMVDRTCERIDLRDIFFDCRGRYEDLTGLTWPPPEGYAPPRSVVGQMAAIVCQAHAGGVRSSTSAASR